MFVRFGLEVYDTLGFVRGARFRGRVHPVGPDAGPPSRAHILAEAPVLISTTRDIPEGTCFECHGGDKHKGDVSIERLIRQSARSSVGPYWDDWDKVAEMLETAADAARGQGGTISDR